MGGEKNKGRERSNFIKTMTDLPQSITGLVPDHCSKVNIASLTNFWFPNANKSYVYIIL